MKVTLKLIYLTLSVSFLVFLAACDGSDPYSAEQRALDDALSKWNDVNTRNYTFNYQRLCFCIQEATDPMIVNIVDNQPQSVISLATNLPVSDEIKQSVKSIDDMFSLIQQGINSRASEIKVSYNPLLGYPESVFIDYDEAMADEELILKASNLSLLNDEVSLTDITWKMVSFNTFEGPQTLVDGTEITLFFTQASSNLGGNSGCNAYGGSFEYDQANSTVSIGSIIQTEIHCETPDGIMEQEQNYLSQLSFVQSYHISESSLILRIGSDSEFQFEAVE